MIGLLVSLIILAVVCAVLWKFGPVALAPLVGSAALPITAAVIIVIVLLWLGGAFVPGWNAPWSYRSWK